MKKVYKVFAIVSGYRGERLAYYDTTPSQLDDVTYSIAEKVSYKSEKEALIDIEKCEEPRIRNLDFIILPVYSKR